LRCAHDTYFNAILGRGMFECKLGAHRITFRHQQHRASLTDRMRFHFHWFCLIRDMQEYLHAQENPLSAASFFSRGLPIKSRTRASSGRAIDVSVRFHSSNPQKSISGATNSMPYSQPSGRALPFHTTTAALVE
jgi:hypothetical protein